MVVEFSDLVPGKKLFLPVVSLKLHSLVFALPISTFVGSTVFFFLRLSVVEFDI